VRFFYCYYGRVSSLEYYTGVRESEIVLGYLDIIPLQSISSELNWDFLSHIKLLMTLLVMHVCLAVTLNSLLLVWYITSSDKE